MSAASCSLTCVFWLLRGSALALLLNVSASCVLGEGALLLLGIIANLGALLSF